MSFNNESSSRTSSAFGETLMAAGRGDRASADRYRRTRFCGLGPAPAHQLSPLEARRPSRSKTRGHVCLLFHDVYVSDPRESGFALAGGRSLQADASTQFDRELAALARVAGPPCRSRSTFDDGGSSYLHD